MEGKELIPYKEKPVILSEDNGSVKSGTTERYIIPKRKKAYFFTCLRFLFFTAILTVVFLYIKNAGDAELSNDGNEIYANTTETSESVFETEYVSADPVKAAPTVIDEAKSGITLDDYSDRTYSLSHLIGISDTPGVLIIHSHSSESVSESITVVDAGKVICDILTTADINAIHCARQHDEDGRLGAYALMNESVREILLENNKIKLIIDLHDSDSEKPLTITVGVDEGFAWQENLRLACAMYNAFKDTEGCIRLLPGTVGQNTGVLTLSIGIGGEKMQNDTGRELIGALAEAIMDLFNKTSPTETRSG